ncbi:MAG: PDDEXK nuclease domain-containing protein [Bacteroidales bacterium]|nr:PDDEXK nuclease domain-containing protein [Bacteroidales bacterium]
MDKEKSLISLTEAVEAIKTAILQGQYEALKDVNRVQLAVYFAIGKYLSENTRKGVWGTGALKQISLQLKKELPGLRGFSETQLKEMRSFYEGWEILDASTQQCKNLSVEISSVATDEINQCDLSVTTGELQMVNNQIDIYKAIKIPDIADFPIEDFFRVPFTHHTRIMAKCKDLSARYYYIHRTAEEHLSVDALEKIIKQQAFENRDKLPNNFSQTITNSSMARKAVMMFKDSYALEFINTEEIGERDRQDIDERVVEQRIVQNIKNFIMTFGKDFSFIGNQYHLEVYGVEFFPDLLFFNRELNSLVVVELKLGEFKPAYLAQLTTYLQILDDHVRKPHENPSIGIVLCKSANKDFVEYVIQKYTSPMGVATYKTAADMPEDLRKALPNLEDLKRIISEGTMEK